MLRHREAGGVLRIVILVGVVELVVELVDATPSVSREHPCCKRASGPRSLLRPAQNNAEYPMCDAKHEAELEVGAPRALLHRSATCLLSLTPLMLSRLGNNFNNVVASVVCRLYNKVPPPVPARGKDGFQCF